MLKHRGGAWVIAGLLLLVMAPGPAWPAKDAALSHELKRLREGQERLERDVAEMKAMLQKLASQPRPPQPQQAQQPQPSRAEVAVDRAIIIGSDKAPAVMVEFCDLQCPWCARYHKETFPQVKRDYIDTGKLLYALIDNPLPMHPQARKAAEALHCAGSPDLGIELAQKLSGEKDLSPPKLAEAAVAIGLDREDMTRCLNEGRYSVDVDRNMEATKKAGITGTPSFVIGFNPGAGKPVSGVVVRGFLTFEQLKPKIEDFLKGR
jgi:protein-disulfide isomerase